MTTKFKPPYLATTIAACVAAGACAPRVNRVRALLGPDWRDTDEISLHRLAELPKGTADVFWVLARPAVLVVGTEADALTVCRWYALACAKASLPVFEKARPGDNRVSKCVEVMEVYLEGRAEVGELHSAAYAADAAAYAAAYADAAAYAAYAAYAAAAYAAAIPPIASFLSPVA